MPSLTLFWVFAFCVTMLPLYVATGSTDSCGKDCRGNAAVCTTSPCNKCGIIFPEDYYVDTLFRCVECEYHPDCPTGNCTRVPIIKGYRGLGMCTGGCTSSFDCPEAKPICRNPGEATGICSPCKNSQECHSANPAFPVFYQRKCVAQCGPKLECLNPKMYCHRSKSTPPTDDGICIPKCKTNEDCSMGTASVCNTTSGLCIRGCSFQSDCKKEGFKTCFQPGTYGECVPDCTTNSDCPKATPTCYQTECGGFCGKPRCQRNIRCDRHSYCANPDFTSENLGHDAYCVGCRSDDDCSNGPCVQYNVTDLSGANVTQQVCATGNDPEICGAARDFCDDSTPCCQSQGLVCDYATALQTKRSCLYPVPNYNPTVKRAQCS